MAASNRYRRSWFFFCQCEWDNNQVGFKWRSSTNVRRSCLSSPLSFPFTRYFIMILFPPFTSFLSNSSSLHVFLPQKIVIPHRLSSLFCPSFPPSISLFFSPPFARYSTIFHSPPNHSIFRLFSYSLFFLSVTLPLFLSSPFNFLIFLPSVASTFSLCLSV